MSKNHGKMICPRCGAEMNLHCDKLVYLSESRQPASPDMDLGGFIDEFHTCPNCGAGASRHT